VLLALAAGLVVGGCGGDDEGAPIPAETATALNAELDGVQARLDQGSAGACQDILEGPRDPNMERAQELIDSMPDDVDSDVRSALQDSFDRLWELVQEDCDEKAQEEQSQREEQPEPEPEATTPTDTETETTPTEPEEPTDTTTVPPEEAPLPNDGDGDSGGEVPVPEDQGGDGGGFGPEDGG
jgi:hypothetical protein